MANVLAFAMMNHASANRRSPREPRPTRAGITIRFKNVRPDGRSRNVQTQQQIDYDDQKPLPGLPDPARRLTVGYQLDPTGTALERIMVARSIGRTVL